MKYSGKAWTVIKCPNCGKKFKSEYMKQYHLDNAKTLCPMWKDINNGQDTTSVS